MADLSGTWLGSYWQWGEPTRFEMSLIQSGNSLVGNILDDGHLGEAKLTGEVIGRTIQFSKSYISTKQRPINYQGTVSEDGETLSGTWCFHRSLGSGTWEAHRKGENLVLEQKVNQQRTLQSSVL